MRIVISFIVGGSVALVMRAVGDPPTWLMVTVSLMIGALIGLVPTREQRRRRRELDEWIANETARIEQLKERP